MSAPFTTQALADEAMQAAQEFEAFVGQCGITKDARYKRDDLQMERLRSRIVIKWALAEFMAQLVAKPSPLEAAE